MNKHSTNFKQSSTGTVIFVLTIAAIVYWIIGKSINVYSNVFLGAIFEFLWLPSLIIVCVFPIASFILWVKENFYIKSVNLFSILLAIGAILIMMLLKK